MREDAGGQQHGCTRLVGAGGDLSSAERAATGTRRRAQEFGAQEARPPPHARTRAGLRVRHDEVHARGRKALLVHDRALERLERQRDALEQHDVALLGALKLEADLGRHFLRRSRQPHTRKWARAKNRAGRGGQPNKETSGERGAPKMQSTSCCAATNSVAVRKVAEDIPLRAVGGERKATPAYRYTLHESSYPTAPYSRTQDAASPRRCDHFVAAPP
jgi:hypothetical protein